jgi:type VI secretion system protein VasD
MGEMNVWPRRALVSALACVTVALWLDGCAKAPVVEPPPPPATLDIEVQASAAVNPDAEGRPSPVVLRVYQLQEATPFLKATLNELWGSEPALLGAALVAQREFALRPGESARATMELPANVRQLGVAAAFRDFRSGTWRAVADVPQPTKPGSKQVLTVALDGDSVSARLEPAPDAGAGK